MSSKDIPTTNNPLAYTVIAYNPSEKNLRGKSRLHRIAETCNLKAFHRAIEQNDYLNIKDNVHNAPLHRAVECDQNSMVHFLIKHGAYIDIPNSYYKTPLHLAVESENIAMITILLQYGADALLKDSYGLDCLDKGSVYIKYLILKHKVPLAFAPNIYIKKTIKIYASVVTSDMESRLKGIHILNSNQFVYGNDVTHYILGEEEEVSLNYIIAVLKGLYIVHNNWIPLVVNNNWLMDTLNYIPKELLPTLFKSIENNYLNRPKLFSGMKFYVLDSPFSHASHNMILTKQDICLLLEMGGGLILRRIPSSTTIEGRNFFPYHSNIKNKTSSCSNFIIYNHIYKVRDESIDSSKLKYLPSKWVIDSILKFSIEFP